MYLQITTFRDHKQINVFETLVGDLSTRNRNMIISRSATYQQK